MLQLVPKGFGNNNTDDSFIHQAMPRCHDPDLDTITTSVYSARATRKTNFYD